MKNSLVFIAGCGTTFEIDGPKVDIVRNNHPVARVLFIELLEFAKKHPLRATSPFKDTWIVSLLKRLKFMKNTFVFRAGREATFVIDGPEVEIIGDNYPIARVPFADLLEFAENHPFTRNISA